MARPTLKDLAKITGLSKSTVAMILRGEESLFAADTVAKVKAVAEGAGWRPNQISRNLQKGRFGTLLYVFSGIHKKSNSSLNLLVGLSQAAEAAGFHLSVQAVDRERETEHLAFMKSLFYDAMIVNIHQFARDTLESLEAWLNRFQVPVVWINNEVSTNAVYPEEAESGGLLASALLKKNIRSVLYIGPRDESHFSARLRPRSLGDSLSGGGCRMTQLRLDKAPVGEFIHPDTRQALDSMEIEAFDAVVFYGPYIISRTLAVIGRRLRPATLLWSFDCTESQDPPGLWRGAAIPWDQVARESVAMAVKLVESGKKTLPSLSVPVHLVE